MMNSQLLFILIIITIATSTPQIIVSVCSFTFTLDPGNPGSKFNTSGNVTSKPVTGEEESIYLTKDPSDSKSSTYNLGSISYTLPLPIKDSSNQLLSFSTSLRFTIRTFTKYNDSGDGVAFVITTNPLLHPNSTGRFLGLMPQYPESVHDLRQFMAVEFDTFRNLEPEVRDPSGSHVGIDISSVKSVKVHDTANPSDPLYLYKNSRITFWVSYNASNHLIQVWATNSSHDVRPPNAILSSVQNLSSVFENYTSIYAAVTAASGNNSEATILYAWNFTIMGEEHKKASMSVILITVAVAVIILASVACFFAINFILKRRKLVLRERRERAAIEVASVSVNQYGYNELRRATGNFSDEQRIGVGGFSIVYKGNVRDGTAVAIKKMRGGLVEPQEIAREVQIISRIKHRNLLELEGWCYEKGEALLVYKYMRNGSLDSFLYGEKSRAGEKLDSEARYKILVGVAAGLDYLHHGLDECVLHRDVKPANVMITETMEAKLGDFGLARLIAHDMIVTSSAGAGTTGYRAPEVENTRTLTEKADVHSFGVLALEVACRRRPLDNYVSSPACYRLKDWVWLHSQNNTIVGALDSAITEELAVPSLADAGANFTLRESQPAGELRKWRCVLHVGLLCCQDDPILRPYMREVYQALKDCIVLPPPRNWTLHSCPPSSPTARTDTETSPRTDTDTFLSLPPMSS